MKNLANKNEIWEIAPWEINIIRQCVSYGLHRLNEHENCGLQKAVKERDVRRVKEALEDKPKYKEKSFEDGRLNGYVEAMSEVRKRKQDNKMVSLDGLTIAEFLKTLIENGIVKRWDKVDKTRYLITFKEV